MTVNEGDDMATPTVASTMALVDELAWMSVLVAGGNVDAVRRHLALRERIENSLIDLVSKINPPLCGAR